MQSLHEAVANALLQAIQNGVIEKGEPVAVTPAYLAVATKFLKDNNIEATKDNETIKKLGTVVSTLPFSQPDEFGLQ